MDGWIRKSAGRDSRDGWDRSRPIRTSQGVMCPKTNHFLKELLILKTPLYLKYEKTNNSWKLENEL